MVDCYCKGRFSVFFGVLFLLFRSTFEQQSSSFVEQIALLQLRSSLGLRSREWPRKVDPCLEWKGVECNARGRVVGINISGFRRTRIGRINPQFAVDSLANLTLLASFNSSNFALPGNIPDWFGHRMKSLQVLDLRACSIIGVIPSSLANCTNLTSLYLSGNSLTGIIPSTLGELGRLSVLDLGHNLVSGSIPTSFALLRNLTVLDISSNFLSGSIFPAIGSLSKLQVLNLSDNSLSSSLPVQLADLSNLIGLDLSINTLSGSLPNDSFTAQSKLQSIILSHNLFSGNLPIILWSIPTLRFLDVSGNNLTGPLPQTNVNVNATDAVFNLSRNMFHGSLTPILSRFKLVDLDGNYFQGKVPDYARTTASLNINCLPDLLNQRAVSECQSFYANINMTFDNPGSPNGTQPTVSPKSPGKSRRNLIILASVLGGLAVIVLLVLVCLILFFCARKKGSTNERSNGVGPVPTAGGPPPTGVALNLSSLGESFTYQQLLQATSEFSDGNLIKHGHSGDLFRGVLEGGIPVVVKRVNLLSLKKEGYLMELDLFSKASHTRLVPLLGHCLENENEKLLVYKYMPNEDLSNSLYKKTDSEDDSLQSLDWITRLKIATGAAEGLTYLHHECTPPLVHRDVQASSILLDDKFEVRLGSLSEVCPEEADAHQRKITRFLRLPSMSDQGPSGSSTSTCAYDVYCFGKVLLELVTGKIGISAASNDTTSKEWLEETLPYISIYDKELVYKIVDPSLIIDEDLLEEVWAMAIVARSCLNPKPSRRPLMRYILKALENPFKVVREENTNSGRLRATSSRGSWNAALFGSWRQSTSDVPATSTLNRVDQAGSSVKQSDGTTTGSQGSGFNGGGVGGGGGHSSSSRRRNAKEIYPQPYDDAQDV